MGSLYRTLSLRYLQQRWSRAVMIVASIALGVATLVATRALNQSMWQAARAAATPLPGLAPIHVSNGDSGVPRGLAEELNQVPGVQEAEPLVIGRVRLPDLGKQRNAQVLGIVWKGDGVENNPWGVKIDWDLPLDWLPLPGHGQEPRDLLSNLKRFHIRPVLVGSELAGELKAVPVDATVNRLLKMMGNEWAEKLKSAKVRIQTAGQEPTAFIKAGTLRADGPAQELVKDLLIMEAGDAAEVLHQPPGLVSRIDLFLKPGVNRNAVLERVREVVDGRAAVRTSEADDQKVQDLMAGLQLGFSLSGAAALVVGLFLVYNALAVSVTERRHEIGILRSLGATRAQIWKLFVGEAALLGLVGAGLGVPVGMFLAHLGLEPVANVMRDFLVEMEPHQVAISPATVLLAAGAGVATALLAALVPARQAAREEPASAVRRIPPTPHLGRRVFQVAGSLALMTAGTACMLLRAWLPERLGTYGGFLLIFLGILLTTPLLAATAARLLQPVARWLLGLEGRLAADNLVRAPARTGLVITALAAGVTMFVQTAGVIRSSKDPILEWVDRSLSADLYVTSGSPITGNGQNLLLQEDLGRTIQDNLSQVAAALPVRTRMVDYGDQVVFLVALDTAGFYAADRDHLLPGREYYPRLTEAGPANALVSENFAVLHNVHPGDTISLRGPRGPVPLRVIGTVEDYGWNKGTVILDRALYQHHFDDPLVDQFCVYLQPGADPDGVRQEMLTNWEAEHALVVWKRAEVRKHYDTQIGRFAEIAYSQEVVVGLVAALGVVTALLISVLQRRRELGILRALGATQVQVLRSVLAEATLMGVIGTVIGLLVGVAVEWYVIQVILFEETGFLVAVRIPWAEAGKIAGLALATATLAGLGPALHTLRLRIPEAIAYE
ncbi:MAG: ABC transporter permease [Planctomycetes bacterium]|nr:ABC transporter permease [Planctomycetota bacterium]